MTRTSRYAIGAVAIPVSIVVFLVPFAFIVLTAVKDREQAALLDFSWPQQFPIIENVREVFAARDSMLVTAFINSTIITVASVSILVVLAAMVGFVLQHRPSRWTRFITSWCWRA